MTQAFVNLGVTQAMSPHVGNFVQDLVEMAKAVETVPVLERALSEATRSLESALAHNQGLESNIISYKQQIEDLNSKVRSLEVERDDASFRVLEMEDKTHQVMGMLIDFEGKAKGARMILDPPKPLPEPEKIETEVRPNVSLADWKQDQAETSRLPRNQGVKDPTAYGEPQQLENVGQAVQFPNADQFQVDSVKDPTASTGQQEEAAHTSPVVSSDAGSTITGTTSVEEAPKSDANPPESSKGPYFGERYYDHPVHIHISDWLRGDGTEADYYWRPEYKS